MGIAGSSGNDSLPMGAEPFVDLDPEIAATDPSERPEVTLDRTRRLLLRARATLDVASKRLNRYHEDESADGPTELS